MKVYIGPFNRFWGIYQILELFPILERDRDAIYDYLENSKLNTFLNWIYQKRNRNIFIKIDNYDVWNADDTMARIILPIMKQLKEQKQGYGFIDDLDVPEELRSYNAGPKEHEYDWDDNAEKRYEWVLNEIIWAFENIVDENWEDQFHTGHIDHVWEKCENSNLSELKHGPNHTHKFDVEGYKAYSARIDNGTTLFGKYFRTFWS